MENIDDYLDDKKRIYAKITAVRQIVKDCKDPSERMRQSGRLRVLTEMYKDVCDNIERLRPPQEKKRKERITVQSLERMGGPNFDFLERTKTCFADIEGTTWKELETTGMTAAENSALKVVLRNAFDGLTDRQKEFVKAATVDGLSGCQIAEKYRVNRSTVSRTLQRASARMQRCVCAHAFISACVTERGFDYFRFAERAQLLTDRQLETFYFILTDCVSMADIAVLIDRNRSTVSRTTGRVIDRFHAVSLDVVQPVSRKIDLAEWKNKTEKEICEMLAMPAGFFYKVVCAKQTVGPYSRWDYEILRLRAIPAEDAAKRMGCSAATIKKHWAMFPGADLSGLTVPEPYHPAKRSPKQDGSLRRAVSQLTSGTTVGDNVSAETYCKMLMMGGETA